jgi:multidrug efflux pump subunit AcrB
MVPLHALVELNPDRAYASITRKDGRRTVNVTANVTPRKDGQRVKQTIEADVLPGLLADFPGLTYSFEGRQAVLADSIKALGQGYLLILLVIYVLLAIPTGSYLQPLIVMLAIPFGILGAIVGHMVMGYSMSIALSGVVVNDSLVMVDYANSKVKEGMTPLEAICCTGARRFRPIMLTTITTFGGLAPMIFETSRQARFMIPMAISLGFGVLFATAISLLLVPCFLRTQAPCQKTICRFFQSSMPLCMSF